MTLTAYRARHLIDGSGADPIRDGVLLVQDQTILAVGPAASTTVPSAAHEVDLGEATLLPGLVDAHVHLVWDASAVPHRTVQLEADPVRTALRMSRHAREMLLRGTTAVRDLGATDSLSLPLAAAIAAGDVLGPEVVAVGRAIAITGGHAHQITHEVDGADAVRRAVREEVKRGARAVKLMASGGIYDEGAGLNQPQMTVSEMSAGCQEAHRAGLRVAAHAYTPGPINAALDAGVDSIEHGSFLDEPTAHRMAEAGSYYVPTAMASHLIVRNAERLGTPDHMLRKALEVVDAVRCGIRAALAAGTPLAAGTDSGGAGIGHGTLVEEAVILHECGADPLEVVRICTSAGAELLDLAHCTGQLTPGYRADVLAVAGDVTLDVHALGDVRLVLKAGTQVT